MRQGKRKKFTITKVYLQDTEAMKKKVYHLYFRLVSAYPIVLLSMTTFQ